MGKIDGVTYLCVDHGSRVRRAGIIRGRSRVHVAGGGNVADVEEIAAPAEVPDGPLDGAFGFFGTVHGDHDVSAVFVVARVGGVKPAVASLTAEVRRGRGLGVLGSTGPS